jgi:hypothetical protein
MNKPILVTYWWGRGKVCLNTKSRYDGEKTILRTYDELVSRLETKAKSFSMDFYSEEIPKLQATTYQTAISYKPQFILKMIRKFKRPVVYIDIDMMIHAYPVLFDNTRFDIMAFNWNADIRTGKNYMDWHTLETSGGLFYFNNTNVAKRILKIWNHLLTTKYIGKADDRVLAIAFNTFRMKEWCRYFWVPMEYFYVPQYFKNVIKRRDVVISHPFRLTGESEIASNRIPSDYNKIIKKTLRNNTCMYIDHSVFNKQQLKHTFSKYRTTIQQERKFAKKPNGYDIMYTDMPSDLDFIIMTRSLIIASKRIRNYDNSLQNLNDECNVMTKGMFRYYSTVY